MKVDIDISKEELNKIINYRGEYKDFYVLRYDMETTEYNNKIVFKTFEKALEEFNITNPEYTKERIELIFSPTEDDTIFGDNVVLMYKIKEE